MDLDRKLDALFSAALSEFTPARNALAAELKAAGDDDAAKRVKSISKPVVSAWAVNAVALRQAELLAHLIAAGEALRQAQARAAGAAQMQTAMKERRQAVDDAVQAAAALLEEHGKGTTSSTLERVSKTFEAIAAYGDNQPSPGAGRLSQDLEPPGFEAFAGMAIAPPRTAPEADTEAPPAAPEKSAAPSAKAELAHAQIAQLEERVNRLKQALREADAAEERARDAAEEAERDAQDLELRAKKARDRADVRAEEQIAAQAEQDEAKAALEAAHNELKTVRG